MNRTIAVLPGDGIGPEVMDETLRVLDAIADKYCHTFTYHQAAIGGAAYDIYQEHCPDETIECCQSADAILFGSVGGAVSAQNEPKWHNCEANSLLTLRKLFNFNQNIRPVTMYPELGNHSPLKSRVIDGHADIVIFRELVGDIYFGEHYQGHNARQERYASDIAEYNEQQISAIAHAAFQAARQRRSHVTSVDKANVLATSRLWREIVTEISRDYPDVTVTHQYVDNCAMQLVTNPGQFDVIVTGNMFGDILSDLASVLPGSLGLIPSASINRQGFGMYEPSGGSAQDIAGEGKANPIAQILSAAMMLEYSFGMGEEARNIRSAVQQAITAGYRTTDIAESGDKPLSTAQMGKQIISYL